MLIKTTNYGPRGQGGLLLPHSFTGPAGQRRAPEHGLMASAAIHRTQGTGWLTGAGCLCRTCLHRCDLCAGCCAGAAFSRTPHCRRLAGGRPRKRLAARSARVVPQQHHCSPTPALWAARGPHVHMCRNLLPTLARGWKIVAGFTRNMGCEKAWHK